MQFRSRERIAHPGLKARHPLVGDTPLPWCQEKAGLSAMTNPGSNPFISNQLSEIDTVSHAQLHDAMAVGPASGECSATSVRVSFAVRNLFRIKMRIQNGQGVFVFVDEAGMPQLQENILKNLDFNPNR